MARADRSYIRPAKTTPPTAPTGNGINAVDNLPGFYSAMFLDTSLEDMGIHTVADMRARFRERHGLLGHLSGAIPGLLAPAGPLGQGQHFAMAGAYLHRDKNGKVTVTYDYGDSYTLDVYVPPCSPCGHRCYRDQPCYRDHPCYFYVPGYLGYPHFGHLRLYPYSGVPGY